MTDKKLAPDELMDALEEMADANGYGITSVTFAPRVQPANSTASYSFTANHLMAADLTTGTQQMMDNQTRQVDENKTQSQQSLKRWDSTLERWNSIGQPE